MPMTLRKLCQYSIWDFKKYSDDRANGADFIKPGANGRCICDIDDCAVAFNYTDARKTGQTVRVAGAMAKRLRLAMRQHPDADQLTVVTMENGNVSVLPTDSLDLRSGYISGGYVATALMVDVRNLRARVQRAVEADAAIIGGADDA